MDRETYGTVTVGTATDTPKELNVIEFIEANFPGDRTISVAKLEDDTFVLSVQNDPLTGRNPVNTMRLGKQSFLFLHFIFTSFVGQTMMDTLAEDLTSSAGDITYSSSPNINL